MTDQTAFHTEVISLERAHRLVIISDTPKGRGVFASTDIAAKSVIEISPARPQSSEEHPIRPLYIVHPSATTLRPARSRADHGGCSNWPIQDVDTGKHLTTQAIVFGIGSMFNHSVHGQNVGWDQDLAKMCVRWQALRDIRAGEELCIHYGRVWFVDEDGEGSEGEEED